MPLSDEQWTRLLADHPAALGAILTSTDLTGDPVLGKLCTAAFAALPVADQARATSVYPWLFGNLEGAPCKARDKANRAVPAITVADVERDLTQAKNEGGSGRAPLRRPGRRRVLVGDEGDGLVGVAGVVS